MNLHPTVHQQTAAADLLHQASTPECADLHAAESLRSVLPSLIAALEDGDEGETASLVRWLVAVDSARTGRIGELRAAEVAFDGPAPMAAAA